MSSSSRRRNRSSKARWGAGGAASASASGRTNASEGDTVAHRKSRVAYFYNHDIGNYYYGPGHPMKPHRLRLTHDLLLSYNLYPKLEVYRQHEATQEEIERFHAHEYIDFLRKISPSTVENAYAKRYDGFNVGPGSDCPIFDGLYEFMTLCAGGSIDAAMKVNHGEADVCVNWSGGLHHAKKGEASGFCYVNDIVLCILELLKYHPRVLYIDIDIHHGDGVEEAFYTTNRVMTASFHKYGDFFPGSGDFRDTGHGEGLGYSVNFPLKDGLTDDSFRRIFKPVIAKIMERYRPGAVVMCCGADSIAGDRLGCWNLSLEGHGHAIDYVKTFGVPVILLGGGGYTPRNVARCWAYETAIALGVQNEMSDEIPTSEFQGYFGPDYRLAVPTDGNMTNANSDAYLDKYTSVILRQLNGLEHAPSVPFHSVPKDFFPSDHHDSVVEMADPDVRGDEGRAHQAEFYGSETRRGDADAERNNSTIDAAAAAAKEGEAELATTADNKELDGTKSILSSDTSVKAKRKQKQSYPPGTECAAGDMAVGADDDAMEH